MASVTAAVAAKEAAAAKRSLARLKEDNDAALQRLSRGNSAATANCAAPAATVAPGNYSEEMKPSSATARRRRTRSGPAITSKVSYFSVSELIF